MRRIITLSLGILCLAATTQAQFSYTDDFEGFSVGAYVAQNNANWTTWSNAPGGPEDAQVTDAESSSPTKSVHFLATNSSGGPTDLVLPFGGEYNTGQFHFDAMFKVASGKGAYFNFQADATIGTLWALEVHMNQNGNMMFTNTSGTYLNTPYPTGTWFKLAIDINLNTNTWTVSIDNNIVGVFSNAVNQVASMDIYPVNAATNGGNGLSEFWMDDISVSYTPYVLAIRNAALTGVGAIHPATLTPGPVAGIIGQAKTVAASVRNLGTTTITSFDIGYSYNGSNFNTTVSGVSIPSLGSYVVEFATPITLASGTFPLQAAVSNVNGQGMDGDQGDDSTHRDVTISTVAAGDKIVIAEEGTGTWCQWCPRGAVYMDYMHDTYDGYFAGVAVHNNDPMALPDYDGAFSGFLTGYPGVLVERGTEIDPLDLETEFLSKVAVAPTAAIVNGATWDTQSRTLNVSLTYTFASGADNQWRVGCILTEDSVTGTTAGYAQSNAYGNNGAGPMGGFELLSTSVPAAMMNYNHVARVISPNFVGAASFPAVVNTADVHTFNFEFVLPATWDENQISIVGMLVDNFGEIDNGSKTSIAEAVSNGFVSGTPIVGIDRPSAPDATIGVYPNPTTGNSWLTLNLTADTDVEVTLRDLQGRTLAQRSYGVLNGSQQIGLQTAELAQGIYLVQVRLGDQVRTQRIVVE